MQNSQDKRDPCYFRFLDWIILTWTGWLTILALLFLLLVVAKPLIETAFLHGGVRYLLLKFVGIAVLITTLNVWEIRKILGHRPYLESSLKFRAEILAGLSIFSFFAQFSQVGSTLDRLSPAERLSQVPVIAEEIHSKSGCGQLTQFPLCKNMEKDLWRLEFYVAIRSEPEVDAVISRLLGQVSSAPQPIPTTSPLIKNLRGLSRSDDTIAWLLLFVPIFTLVSASLAISTKIALAWPKKGNHSSPPAEDDKAPESPELDKALSITGSVDVTGLVKVEKSNTESASLVAATLVTATFLYVVARAIAKSPPKGDS